MPLHRSSAGLLLAEMDRLPDAEDLWLDLATRLESWNLDDDLGPRYEQAIERFARAGWWSRAARWYAARARHRELDRLAGELAARFRGTAVFERAPVDDSVCLEVPEQPRAGVRVRLAAWGDWVRLKALERFPHSPTVFHEARARLLRRSATEDSSVVKGKADPVIVDDALLDERGWAVLFADDQRREEYLADAVRKGVLPARLAEWQGRATRTPVLDLLLFEGHARLSHFEDALDPASRLAALYPGDGDLARRVLSLQRSLASLDPGAGAAAAALVARTTPALVDPAPLWTELGEMEYERGRPDLAKDAWRHILDRSPRDPERISQLATVLWDYGEMDDALATIEDARRRLSRPSLLAFEAGVLHEEKAAIEPAVREYLNAGLPDESECFCSAFERDQRALRRLSQLIGRERVRGIVEARIAALQPGVTPDEETLVAFYPLTTIRMPDAGLDWTTDDWIDAMDHPVDPVARTQRKDDRERWRATMREGQQRLAGALLARTKVLVAAASRPAFLDAVERWSQPLLEAQPTREDEVALTTAVMARRAALASTVEDRITREMALARYLFEKGRRAEADEAWKSIASRVGTLPEGAPRMRAEAERAAYLERSQGAPAAAAEWERLFARYPWSLGILEDELAFLSRVGRSAEGRRLLESTVARAAEGHREALLERLAREALEAGELAQAQRAAEGLLASPTTDDGRRLAAVHLVARLALRRDPTSDLGGLVKQQEPRVAAELRAELRAQVARAAALESAWTPAVALWIEALNRRLDRGWLREACRAAERAGQGEALLSFFARQRERSPRDVRWAVALRELRLYFDDVPGALDAARAAIAVRPDRGPLWSETADLLARLGRPREGADLLAEWQKPRPADEQAAARRAALVTLAGDGEGALAIERAALDAFAASPLADEQPDELAERRGRAARRLLELGLPLQAFALLSPSSAGRSPTLVDSRLGDWGEAELALAAGRLLPLLRQRIGDDGFRVAAASVLSSRGRPEQREQVLRWIADEVLKDAAAARSSGRSFATLWLLAERSSLDEPLRVELARRTLARAPGPWAQAPPEAFVSAVGRVLIGSPPRLLTPPLERMWAADLVRRARAEELWLFLAPRWDALLGDVRSAVPVSTRSARREWTTWLDDRTALALWAEAAQRDPARIASLASVLTERRSWDRFWALAARGWDTGPLVAALPDDARRQWFRIWLQPSPTDPNPALRARGESVERAAIALGRLVAGIDGAAADPVVLALRGPRTVGAVLDDAGPWQADLWGERPGPAWLVLEALSRLREKDPQAALVPLEVGDRGGETGRARIASRLAESAGNLELALALVPDASSPASTDLARRLRLLQRVGRTEEVVAGFRAEVRRQQPKLSEASFRALTRIGEDLGLPDPVSLLDREIAVPGPFAAALCELRGLSICRELKTVDPAGFRTALSARWQRGPRGLSAEETRFALTELWAREAGPLPDRGLRRLGGVWPHATTWLSSVRLDERRDAVAALDALPDITRLLALVAREGASPAEPTRLLLTRVHLLRGDDDAARALLEDRLARLEDASRLGFASVTPAAESAGLEGERADGATFEEATEPELPAPGGDAFVETLRSWLAPFRDAKKQALVDASVRAALRRHVESIPGSADAWALALDLIGSADERVSVLAGLERAWRLGDLDAAALAPLVASAGRVSPADADRWLSRLSPGFDYERVSARARLLSRLGRKADGARKLVAARARSSWTLVEEVKAFDLWRSLAPETETAPRVPAPPAWSAARVFWKRPPSRLGDDLAVYLHAHPLDLRVARVALRSVAPADPELMALAERAIEQPAMQTLGQPFGDARFLHLRAARALLPLSPRAARSALGGQDPDLARDLERRRMPAADVRAALADLARLQGGAEPAAADAALAALEDRSPSEGKELRAEIARLAARSGPPAPYRLVDGRPEPWRPRDLAWSVLETALDAEGVR